VGPRDRHQLRGLSGDIMVHIKSRTRLHAFSLASLGIALLLIGSIGVVQAQSSALGSEFRVNKTTALNQGSPRVSSDALGNFIVVWQSTQSDNSGTDIYSNRYTADGKSLGGQTLVNKNQAGYQSYPSVAMDPAGNYLVAWQALNADGSGPDVYARRFTSIGKPLGGETRVNTTTGGNSSGYAQAPAVAANASGQYIVLWVYGSGSSYGIYGQRYKASGDKLGTEFRLDAPIGSADEVMSTSVSYDAQGNFVAAWSKWAQVSEGSGHSYYTYYRRYGADGQTLNDQTLIGSPAATPLSAVACDAAGDFVVAWESYGSKLRMQGFSPSGSALGAITDVATLSGPYSGPNVASDAQGHFTIVWQNYSADGSGTGVLARRYSASGAALGDAYPVNTYTAGNQSTPVVASTPQGETLIAWNSTDQDGSAGGVYAQRYRSDENVDLDVTVSGPSTPVGPGALAGYEIVVSNLHPTENPTGVAAIDSALGIATALVVQFKPPAGVSNLIGATDGWNCAVTNGKLKCTRAAALPAASSTSLFAQFQAPAEPSTLKTSASISADQLDDNTANNSSSVSTTVDTAPAQLNFAAIKGAQVATKVTSEIKTLSGFTLATPVSITGGEYRRNGGSWTSAPGNVHAGDTIQLRTVSSSQYATTLQVQLMTGVTLQTWSVTTRAAP
jgi:hypothetical protein